MPMFVYGPPWRNEKLAREFVSRALRDGSIKWQQWPIVHERRGRWYVTILFNPHQEDAQRADTPCEKQS